MPGINDESDLGYYYAHEAGIYSEKDLGPLANYIDYERYGRDIAMDEQGRFTDEGYVRVASERWDRQFNGGLDDIPDEYRITGSEEAAERDSTIAVLVVEPGKEPYVKAHFYSNLHSVGNQIYNPSYLINVLSMKIQHLYLLMLRHLPVSYTHLDVYKRQHIH